jgi:hypothetical protein
MYGGRYDENTDPTSVIQYDTRAYGLMIFIQIMVRGKQAFVYV